MATTHIRSCAFGKTRRKRHADRRFYGCVHAGRGARGCVRCCSCSSRDAARSAQSPAQSTSPPSRAHLPRSSEQTVLNASKCKRRTGLAAVVAAAALVIRQGQASAQDVGFKSMMVDSALKSLSTDIGPGGSQPGSASLRAQQALAPVQVLPSGVRFRDLVVGEGEELDVGDLVVLNVIGSTRSGGVFVNTKVEKSPLVFTMGILPIGVCEGLDDGVRSMLPGGRRVLEIPAELAYGNALGPIRMDVEMLQCARLDSGAISCCQLGSCDPSSPNTVSLFGENDDKTMPLSNAFADLDALLNNGISLMMDD